MPDEPTNLGLVRGLNTLRQRAWVIVLCLVVASGAAYIFSRHEQKQYTASAQLLFRSSAIQQQAAGLQAIASINPQADTDTNLKLATLPRVASETAAALGHGMTASRVAAATSVTQISDTNLISVTSTLPSPRFAADVANAYARQVIAERQSTDAGYYATALRAVDLQYAALSVSQKRGAQGADLTDRAASLQILSRLQSSEVQLQQSATAPSGASSPKVFRNTILGALLGLFIGFGSAFLLQNLDRRLRDPSDLEEVYGVPLLGVVPESSVLAKAARRAAGGMLALPPREAETFGLLRAHLRYFNVDRDLRTLLVLSAAAGDGKTTIARQLAIAEATTGTRVLFVEADLRRPVAAFRFGIDAGPGLYDILVAHKSLIETVHTVEFETGDGSPAELDVLPAGRVLPPNPAEVLESQAMTSLLDEAKRTYQLVIVDTPPVMLVPDAFPLLQAVDGVLVVSRLGRNRRDVAVRLRETLDNAEAPLMGVVANGFKQPRGSNPYGYDYKYRYTFKESSPNGSTDVTSESSSNGPARSRTTRD